MAQQILLIEDNAEMAANISGILELAHYDVVCASNGKEGVDIAQKIHPDLILCDIMMPDLDGYGVLHIIHNDPETAGIPFIFLTAKAEKEDFRLGMNLGADDYIAKPFDGIDLLKVVEMRLKKNDQMKAALGNNNSNVSSFFNKAREMKEFQKLSENRPVRTFRKKDMIFMEGQIPNDLFRIEEGQVKTYKVNYDGKELITGLYAEGDFLGYVALLEERPYAENAEAMENVRLAIIPKEDFLNMMYSSKDVARKFIRILSRNYSEMEERLLEVAYQSVRQRVAHELIKLEERAADANRGSLISFTRRDISNIVGTATESLNRTLADFKDEGLIEIKEDGLRILNKQKLERMLHI